MATATVTATAAGTAAAGTPAYAIDGYGNQDDEFPMTDQFKLQSWYDMSMLVMAFAMLCTEPYIPKKHSRSTPEAAQTSHMFKICSTFAGARLALNSQCAGTRTRESH